MARGVGESQATMDGACFIEELQRSGSVTSSCRGDCELSGSQGNLALQLRLVRSLGQRCADQLTNLGHGAARRIGSRKNFQLRADRITQAKATQYKLTSVVFDSRQCPLAGFAGHLLRKPKHVGKQAFPTAGSFRKASQCFREGVIRVVCDLDILPIAFGRFPWERLDN